DSDQTPDATSTPPPVSATTATSPTASTTATSEPTAEETGTTTPTDPTGTQPPPSSTQTPSAPVREPQAVAAVPVYENATFQRPVDVVAYPVAGYDLLVAEQGGQLVGLGAGGASVLLDLSLRMQRSGNEEGLLSIAVDPAFATNSHVWVYYSNTGQPRRTVVSRFTAAADGSIDTASELIVIEVPQPFGNHNGGALRFGPDGMLYLGLGDGGSGGDPQGNGQNLGTLLGSVIRISVAGASEVEPYAIPDNNPFVGVGGAREEIWAYGLRNPWRMSFDPLTGALWLADVGQNRQEEVNRIERGDNYGWNVVEGLLCYPDPGCDPSPYESPLAVYDRGGGRCSVTGGVVARGVAASGIEGHYLFGDYCSGDLWALPSDTDGSADAALVASGLGNVASINQVGDEIYVLTFGSPLRRLVDR
ncbi:MAG: PQQ-dependent sugar dehydrogenase, partial [Chloroflexi bacterium]|nr:PQQ-dependent sugar dehydrogenase [Chloroflexota bacterium]